MADETTLITRTKEEDRRFAQAAAQQALKELDLADIRHKMRLESGTCYARDLAWLWDRSTETVRRRLSDAGVEPVSTEGKEHLWDVEEATRAVREG